VVNQEWSDLHSGAEVGKFIGFWLGLLKALARPFVWVRITPNQISIIAVVISFPLIFDFNYWWLILIGLLLDGIDGQVALATNRASKSGAVIDSISDRTVEFIWAIGMILLGMNFALVLTFIGLAWIQEYLRARAGGLGFRKIGLITIGERPTRGVFAIFISIFTAHAQLILWMAVIVQAISLLTLVRVFEKEINQ
jgi:phosphatidylglycerophosphate synthase